MSDCTFKSIVILGAGISGLTAAYELTGIFGKKVVVVEKESYTGGLSATLKINELNVDIGSHRIQSTVSRKIRCFITDTLGVELIKQPRRGLLYLHGMKLKYPPSFSNFLSVFPIKQSLSYLLSFIERFRYPYDTSSYKSAMLHNVGKRIYEHFYEDFVFKLWGIAPEQISIEGMNRRKTIFNMKSVVKNITGKHDYFYYPRHGIGSIADKLTKGIIKNGGKILSDSQILSIQTDSSNTISKLTILNSSKNILSYDYPLVLSTIPLDDIHAHLFPGQNNSTLKWRETCIAFLHISEELQISNETFYFPGRDFPSGRISFIQKYSPHLNQNISGTVITFEFPVSIGDNIWEMDDLSLSKICINDLQAAGIINKNPTIVYFHAIRVNKAYPIYEIDWKIKFDKYLNNLKKVNNLCVFGRRGLFLHCNVDHAIRQGQEIASLISINTSNINKQWNHKIDSFSSFCARD
ncbi:MAG: NAD(P)-binding protein [Fibrobacter sp.]|jgi:protoporphyrinogen oxidase|nr:NAD(P)-binding protein [Fibrobacter sp.]